MISPQLQNRYARAHPTVARPDGEIVQHIMRHESRLLALTIHYDALPKMKEQQHGEKRQAAKDKRPWKLRPECEEVLSEASLARLYATIDAATAEFEAFREVRNVDVPLRRERVIDADEAPVPMNVMSEAGSRGHRRPTGAQRRRQSARAAEDDDDDDDDDPDFRSSAVPEKRRRGR
jgi:hypothetical protein